MKKQFPRTDVRGVAMALALAGLFGSANLVASSGVEPSGRATYDPLLDAQGNVCAPAVAGRPPLLQKLILAQTETKPFKPQPMQAAGGDVPLYDNLGTLSLKVGTRNAKAQAYFDQGMRWAFGFNHAEAQRAFQAAQKADPKLAMAWWGEALVLGPNINAPMVPEAVAPATGRACQGGRIGARCARERSCVDRGSAEALLGGPEGRARRARRSLRRRDEGRGPEVSA